MSRRGADSGPASAHDLGSSTRSPTLQTALLLIDVQPSFVHRPCWSTDDVPAFLAHTTARVAGCTARGVPVVRVFHREGPASRDNPSAAESGLIRPLDGLAAVDASAPFDKERHSALERAV